MNKEMIKEIVSNYFELDIVRNTRKRQYVEARAMFYKLCREFTKLSLEEIGKQVKRDHASVLHGIRSLNNWIEYDNRIKNNLRILRNKISHFEDEKDTVIELDESIVLKYVQLKEQVKEQDEIINDLRNALKDITEKHERREKFYQKYGFID